MAISVLIQKKRIDKLQALEEKLERLTNEKKKNNQTQMEEFRQVLERPKKNRYRQRNLDKP